VEVSSRVTLALAREASPDELALEELWVRHYPDVFRYVRAFVPASEAEDVVSDVYTRAVDAWRRGRGPVGPALPWLLLIARRLTTDRWRRAKRVLWHRLPPGLVDRAAEADAREAEFSAWISGLSAVLTSRQHEALVLRYLGSLSDAETAAILEMSESGVRSLISRALRTLRSHEELWR
jgi:RNA polymerase sigma-70 factor (ECF subfamily)